MMKTKVFLTCAVNGSGDTASKHPDLPKTPKQIAICFGVFGRSGCLDAVSPDPLTAHVRNTLVFIIFDTITLN